MIEALIGLLVTVVFVLILLYFDHRRTIKEKHA